MILALALSCLPFAAMATDTLSDEELAALFEQVENTDLAIDEEYRVAVDQNDLSVNGELSDDWWNILLLGTDTGGALNYGRTDAMLILSIQVSTGAFKLASLERDMWVTIPGLKSPNRINAANSFGGPYLAIKTVNSVLDLNIEQYFSINFTGLETLVDIVGGVSLDITKAEAHIAEAQYQEGGTVLNGEQALKYARTRQLDNNFGRNERQRKLLVALADKVLDTMDLSQIIGITTTMLTHMDTNLPFTDILTLVNYFVANDELQIDMLSLPQQGEYSYGSTDGISKVNFDQDATTQALHEFIYGS